MVDGSRVEDYWKVFSRIAQLSTCLLAVLRLAHRALPSTVLTSTSAPSRDMPYYNGGQVSSTVCSRACRMMRSSRRKPVLSKASIARAAEGIMPRCLANITSASVPLTGTENAHAHFRASRSSRMAVQPGLAIAQARTAVSPAPRSQARSSGGRGSVSTMRYRPADTMRRAVSRVGPASTSEATRLGTTI
jgi:hypothetical protein